MSCVTEIFTPPTMLLLGGVLIGFAIARFAFIFGYRP